MTANGWLQIGLFVTAIFLVTKPLGVFMVRVFEREKTWLDFLLRPIEKLIYWFCGVDEKREMRWTESVSYTHLLADINDGSAGVFKNVDAGRIRKQGRFFAWFHGISGQALQILGCFHHTKLQLWLNCSSRWQMLRHHTAE